MYRMDEQKEAHYKEIYAGLKAHLRSGGKVGEYLNANKIEHSAFYKFLHRHNLPMPVVGNASKKQKRKYTRANTAAKGAPKFQEFTRNGSAFAPVSEGFIRVIVSDSVRIEIPASDKDSLREIIGMVK